MRLLRCVGYVNIKAAATTSEHRTFFIKKLSRFSSVCVAKDVKHTHKGKLLEYKFSLSATEKNVCEKCKKHKE